jgi:hypothetical protein
MLTHVEFAFPEKSTVNEEKLYAVSSTNPDHKSKVVVFETFFNHVPF